MIGDVGLSSSPESAVVPMQVDLPAPGLIRARHLVSLIQHPETFRAAKIDIRSWPGSNRFLEVNRSFGLAVAAVWIAMICGLTAWGVSLVSAERSGHVLPVLLSWALLSPAVVSLAGLAGRFLGVEHWSVWLVLSSLILVMLSYALASGLRKWSTGHHPLLAVFAVGLVTMAAIDPIWSFMSPVFGGRSGVVSPLALGAVFGYLVGFIASLSGAGTVAQWVGRAACFAFLAGGLGLRAWWTPDLGSTLFVPVAALLIGEGHFRWPMLVAFGLWPSSLVPLVTGGFVWAPMGLLVHGHDRQGINLAGYVDFIGSPSLALFILVAGGIAIFGFRFFFHQMRMLGKLDARRHALSFAALSAAAFGLLHPVFLFSSLTVGAGALMAMLFDAVQTM